MACYIILNHQFLALGCLVHSASRSCGRRQLRCQALPEGGVKRAQSQSRCITTFPVHAAHLMRPAPTWAPRRGTFSGGGGGGGGRLRPSSGRPDCTSSGGPAAGSARLRSSSAGDDLACIVLALVDCLTIRMLTAAQGSCHLYPLHAHAEKTKLSPSFHRCLKNTLFMSRICAAGHAPHPNRLAMS